MNPGLNAVPLIVIVFITAVKDAIEDYRRTILDNELNNSPVHRLVDWQNVNVSADSVSPWRKLKKATSRGIVVIWRLMKRLVGKGGKGKAQRDADRALDESRPSVDTRVGRRESTFSAHTQRTSFASAREEIQMTPVPSPLPRTQEGEVVEGGSALTPQRSERSRTWTSRKPHQPKSTSHRKASIPPGLLEECTGGRLCTNLQ